MKKHKITAIVLAVLFISSIFTAIPASAASDGFKDFNEAAGGKKILMYPLYLTGGEGFANEGSENLLAYDKPGTKYCSNQLPYYAEWKYEKAYTVERIILRTANDNKSSPRRMGDGWTLSGSNDYQNWTVIYTGSENDVLNENNTSYFVDLPDNKDAYQYYKLNADDVASDQTDTLIQLSMFILCVNESVEVPAERPYITRPNIIESYGTSIIEAPDFDSGKYFDAKEEGSYICRPDEKVQTEYCGADYVGRVDIDGNPIDGTTIGNIGYTNAGEWVQYTVDVKKDGVYKFDAWVASDSTTPGSVDIYLDGGDNPIGSAASVKAGWQNYSKATAAENVEMTAGSHVIKVLFPTGAVNFQALEITKTGNIEVPTEAATEAPTTILAADNTDNTTAAAAVGGSSSVSIPMILWIAIGAVVLIIIIIVAILLTRKKK